METGPHGDPKEEGMKKLLTFGAVACITTALLDPLVYSAMDRPVPWLRDVILAVAGIACLYALVKFRHYY
jgi:hypothetical protein